MEVQVRELPKRWQFLLEEPAPLMLVNGLETYGTLEGRGYQNNPLILNWANYVGGWIGDWYDSDHIPWCGLWLAYIAKRSGKPVSQKALNARSWMQWGFASKTPQLGDVLVFRRPGGGHVGLYVGESDAYFHVLGGNQNDRVSIMRIAKTRLVGARRYYEIGVPKNIRRVFMGDKGTKSMNEL